MKIKYALPLLWVFALLFYSCEETVFFDPNNLPTEPSFGEFWAVNCRNDKYYRVDAEIRATGKNCEVWVEKGSRVSDYTAKNVADEFDKYIFDNMIKAFSIEYEDGLSDGDSGELIGHNIMDLAYWISGRDEKKLCILLLNIQDSYKGPSDSYVAGYFHPYDLVYPTNFEYSNKRCMIYIDSDPGKPGELLSNVTLAHEMQHLMNFVTSYYLIIKDKRTFLMDLWIDEGLSAAAEWVYGNAHPDVEDEHPKDRWDWFNRGYGLINTGNNFFTWGNHDENQYAILDDYATVYLFFQWLRLQAKDDGSTIYYDIITSNRYDYRAVTEAANNRIPGHGFNDWGTLLKAWLAANYINAPDSIYGYMNDPALMKVKAKTVDSKGNKSIDLAPGEGVYSTIKSSVNPSPSTYIRYAGLQDKNVVNSGPFTSGALLTYNVNTNKTYSTSPGFITGNPSINYVPDQLSRQISGPPGPYPISAADMLRQNGYGGGFSDPSIVNTLLNGIVRER